MNKPACTVNKQKFPTSNNNTRVKMLGQRGIFAKALRAGH